MDINTQDLPVGFHSLKSKKDIYLSLKPGQATQYISIYSDENIDVFNAMFHHERIGLLFSFPRPFKVLSSGANNIVIDRSCGMGPVFWCDAASVNSNDSATVIVHPDERYDTETS